jgi:hypothetical protein
MEFISLHISKYAGAAADDAVMLVHLQPSNHKAMAAWSDAAQTNGWKLVVTPITISGPLQGPGMTFVNCPSINMQSFLLFKRHTRPHPWSNYKVAMKVADKGFVNAKWRMFWNACINLPGPDYKLGRREKRLLKPADVHAGDEGPAGLLVPEGSEWLQAKMKDTNKRIRQDTVAQRGMWRRQQLSQGVLRQILLMFGRCSVDQVRV